MEHCEGVSPYSGRRMNCGFALEPCVVSEAPSAIRDRWDSAIAPHYSVVSSKYIQSSVSTSTAHASFSTFFFFGADHNWITNRDSTEPGTIGPSSLSPTHLLRDTCLGLGGCLDQRSWGLADEPFFPKQVIRSFISQSQNGR